MLRVRGLTTKLIGHNILSLKEPTIKKSIGKAKKDEKNNEEVEARQKGYREVAEKAYEKNQTGRS